MKALCSRFLERRTLRPSRGSFKQLLGAAILALGSIAPGAKAALLWDWHFSTEDNYIQQGTFVTTDGDVNDPSTIYTVLEFSVTRSDAGHVSVGAPIGSTTDGTYRAFADVPMTFRVVDGEIVTWSDSGELGGRYDTDYDSPDGWHIFLFTNIPNQPFDSSGYLFYNPPEGPQECCNVGRVFTGGPEVIAFKATPKVLWPPNGRLVPVTVAPSHPGLVDCAVNAVRSNEPITPEDYLITGALTVDLRAERFGNRRDRIYVIDVICQLSGQPITGSATVTVPHDKGKKGKGCHYRLRCK